MWHNKPRDDEVEQKYWIHRKSFSVRRLAVAHENNAGIGRPEETTGWSHKSQEEGEVGLAKDENSSANDERKGERH